MAVLHLSQKNSKFTLQGTALPKAKGLNPVVPHCSIRGARRACGLEIPPGGGVTRESRRSLAARRRSLVEGGGGVRGAPARAFGSFHTH